jgi:hypothetical protein
MHAGQTASKQTLPKLCVALYVAVPSARPDTDQRNNSTMQALTATTSPTYVCCCVCCASLDPYLHTLVSVRLRCAQAGHLAAPALAAGPTPQEQQRPAGTAADLTAAVPAAGALCWHWGHQP